jgi:hypothetical protein
MPRKKSPPRLYLDRKRGQWTIKDGDVRQRTGHTEAEREAAEKRLADYLATRKIAEIERRPSFVYFIECGGYIKIGYTSLKARLSSLATANPYPLKVLATVEGDQQTEELLHNRFADAFHRGEWFRKTPELLAFIDEIVGKSAA